MIPSVTASEDGQAQLEGDLSTREVPVQARERVSGERRGQVGVECHNREGEIPVHAAPHLPTRHRFTESLLSGFKSKVGGSFLRRLNTCQRPIAQKYCEGKMKRTPKGELRVREILLVLILG